MSQNQLHRRKTNAARFARRYGFALRLMACFASIFSATVAVGLEDSGNLIWVANGLLLSYLLLAPRWLWRHYFAIGFVAILFGGLAVHPDRWDKCVALSILNIIEVVVAACMLRRRTTELPDMTDQRYLLRFAGCAVLAAPCVTGILFATAYWLWMRASPWFPLLDWITTDGLGTAIVAPACISLFSSHLKQMDLWRRYWALPVAFIPIAILSFCQYRVPVVFLIYPLIAFILFRFGLGWASIAVLFVSAVGSWFTIHEMGPFARIGSVSPIPSTVLLQLYVASGMFLVLAAASVLEALRATERRLREIVSLHNLVTENSRDVIILADFNGNRIYVSASASKWGGWRPDELTVITSLELVHPEDRRRAEAIVRSLRLGSDGGLLECRVRNKLGEYVWVEANLRPVRDPNTGAAVGILNIVRDISRRKDAEQELNRANAALKALAVTDALTHLANRRKFDGCLSSEWRRCLREQLPLSLLLLDADWFKSYNDTYGHPRGDKCLKQIAEVAQEIVRRSGDLVARVGGEEFAVILPNTSGDGALEVAQQICAAILRRKIPHNTNPQGYVTLSIGCATVVPSLGLHATTLMRRADEALYAAKHAGRNQVCSAHAQSSLNAALQAS